METLAWRSSLPQPQLLRACSSPTSPSAPLAPSDQAAASLSKGCWATAPPSPGTCLGRGHPLSTSQTTPPSRLPYPAGHPCLCTPSPTDLGSPAQKAPRPRPGWGWGAPQPRPQPRVQLCAPGPLVRSLTHLPGAAPCVGRAAPGGAGPRASWGCGALVLHGTGAGARART